MEKSETKAVLLWFYCIKSYSGLQWALVCIHRLQQHYYRTKRRSFSGYVIYVNGPGAGITVVMYIKKWIKGSENSKYVAFIKLCLKLSPRHDGMKWDRSPCPVCAAAAIRRNTMVKNNQSEGVGERWVQRKWLLDLIGCLLLALGEGRGAQIVYLKDYMSQTMLSRRSDSFNKHVR